MLTVLFDGVASGALLFLLAIGLSITLGIMNFTNLAHGAFAMLGGYLTVVMLNRWGISFFYCLPVAFLAPALAGVILERAFYSRLYDADPRSLTFSRGKFTSSPALTWALTASSSSHSAGSSRSSSTLSSCGPGSGAG